MELLVSLFKNAVNEGKIQINIDFEKEFYKIAHDTCYQTLLKIHEILDTPNLSDFECTEEIVKTLEEIEFNGGCRHDF